MATESKTKKEEKVKEAPKFKGKYISAVGRRKTSVARIRLYKKGEGVIIVNDQDIKEYLPENLLLVSKQALKIAGMTKDVNISVVVKGGGLRGQAEAIRLGITRALISMEEGLKASLKTKGLLSRDPRKKERKKPGLKKARRAAQWSKR